MYCLTGVKWWEASRRLGETETDRDGDGDGTEFTVMRSEQVVGSQSVFEHCHNSYSLARQKQIAQIPAEFAENWDRGLCFLSPSENRCRQARQLHWFCWLRYLCRQSKPPPSRNWLQALGSCASCASCLLLSLFLLVRVRLFFMDLVSLLLDCMHCSSPALSLLLGPHIYLLSLRFL